MTTDTICLFFDVIQKFTSRWNSKMKILYSRYQLKKILIPKRELNSSILFHLHWFYTKIAISMWSQYSFLIGPFDSHQCKVGFCIHWNILVRKYQNKIVSVKLPEIRNSSNQTFPRTDKIEHRQQWPNIYMSGCLKNWSLVFNAGG